MVDCQNDLSYEGLVENGGTIVTGFQIMLYKMYTASKKRHPFCVCNSFSKNQLIVVKTILTKHPKKI